MSHEVDFRLAAVLADWVCGFDVVFHGSEQAMSDFHKLECPQCGQLRMNTPSGSVCPDGCGRLYPPISDEEFREYHDMKLLSHLPVAARYCGFVTFFQVEGTTGYWRNCNRSVAHIEANYHGSIIGLERYVSLQVERRAERWRSEGRPPSAITAEDRPTEPFVMNADAISAGTSECSAAAKG